MGIENEEIAELYRWYVTKLNSKDYSPLFSSDNRVVGGYGYRLIAWRDEPIPEAVNKMFVDSIEYYQIEIEDLNTWSENGIGLGWGTWIESYQHKGQNPERARVRFTNTFLKFGDEWVSIMFHRDAQPFNEDGSYQKKLVQVK